MKSTLKNFFFVAIVSIFSYSNAFAHPVAQGSMDFEIEANSIVLSARVSMEQMLVYAAQKSVTKDLGALWIDHSEYISSHLHIIADGEELQATGLDVFPASEKGIPTSLQENGFVLYHFKFFSVHNNWSTNNLKSIVINQNMLTEFEFAPGNNWEATFIVRFRHENKLLEEGLLLTSRQPVVFDVVKPSADSEIEETSNPSYFKMSREFVTHGIFHILTGYDHLLFVAALVLATLTFWDLFKIVSAFTLAHTITLMLATFNIVRLSSSIVEPMIAASIVFIAVQNIFWPRNARGNSRLVIAFLFGLFHGLGFAGGLLDAMQGMSLRSVWVALLSFSFGVEIGHQVVVLPLFGFLFLMRKMQSDVGSEMRASLQMQRIGSVAIGIAGIFFLVSALTL